MTDPAIVQDQSNLEKNIIQEVSNPVYQSRGWLKLIGIVSIVQGILVALTIVGVLVAWLPIWMGVVLYRAATSAENAQGSGQKYELIESLNNLKTYFTINGVIMLIGLIILFLSLCGVIVAIVTGIWTGTEFTY